MSANKKTRVGMVVGNKMQKTVVVRVSQRVKHPFFQKYYTRSKKFKAHDETNACGVGDKVLIEESPPISREKRWKVTQVLEKSGGINL